MDVVGGEFFLRPWVGGVFVPTLYFRRARSHTTLGKAESRPDFRGAASVGIDQLGDGDSETARVSGAVTVDRIHPDQIGPVAIVAENPYLMVDRSCPLRDDG